MKLRERILRKVKMVKPKQITEDEKLCPWLKSPCIKEKCRRYSSMQVIEVKLGVPTQKTIYTCMENIQLGLMQTLVNIMSSSLAQQQMKNIKGFPGIEGLQGPGFDLRGPKG